MSKEDLWLEVSRIKLSLDEKLEELEKLSTSLMEVMDELEEEEELEEDEEEKSVISERGEKPKDGEDYWFVAEVGDIVQYKWCDDSMDSSLWKRRFINHLSKNEKYVEFMQERDRIISKLAEKARPFKPWKENWNIECKYSNSSDDVDVCIYYYTNFQASEFYFDDKKTARNLIDEIGEENLIKYYFMVEG